MLKVLSLFSGIGAFEKALTNINIPFELVNFCEIDKYAEKSYCAIHNIDKSKNLGDITKIDINNLATDIDLITHSSPCQDFSIAGKNEGGDKNSGTRSSLMWNSTKIIKHCKPKYVIWENVKNVLSPKHKHNFEAYLQSLEESGYNNYYKVLNARDHGIAQNRDRIFCVSIRSDVDNKDFEFHQPIPLTKTLKDYLDSQVDEKYYLNTMQGGMREPKIVIDKTIKPCVAVNFEADKGKISKSNKDIYQAECSSGWQDNKVGLTVAPTLRANNPTTHCLDGFLIRKLTPLECWRLMGFDDIDFNKAQGVGISNSQLYKQAGNSICVPVLEKIFNNIFKTIENKDNENNFIQDIKKRGK